MCGHGAGRPGSVRTRQVLGEELATRSAPGAADAPPFGRLGLTTLRLARLLVSALPAHVCQDARALNLAAELPEGLLQILPLPDMDLQLSVPLWSFRCAYRSGRTLDSEPLIIVCNGQESQERAGSRA